MDYSIRQIMDSEASTHHPALTMDAVASVVAPELVRQILAAHGCQTRRKRKLDMPTTVWTLIGMYLYGQCGLEGALHQLMHGPRLVGAQPQAPLAGRSALTYRRQHVSVPAMAALCRAICRPLATPRTVGAFRFGLRLMAVDGTVDAVADTPENAAVFGRAKGRHGTSAYPQVRGVHLVECGTHALVDATFWPYGVSEHRGAARLMRSVAADWLLMWDAGLHSFDLFAATRQRQAHVLARLPKGVKVTPLAVFADGSWLADLRPTDWARRRAGEHVRVRVIEYVLNDAALSPKRTRYRLATTLLDPECYPARDLAETFHARWEFEGALDQIETHQRVHALPVRAQSPRHVLQELYALVIAHFIFRALMHEAAVRAYLAPSALSFMRALDIIRHAITDFQILAPHSHPALLRRLFADLTGPSARLPPRRCRMARRVIKRRVSKFLPKHSVGPPDPPPTVRAFIDAILLIPCPLMPI